MERYSRLLVCLDDTDRDAAAIAWAGRIAAAARSSRVHFVHVRPAGSVPASIAAEHPGLVESDGDLTERFRQRVAEGFKVEVETVVHVGGPSDSPVIAALQYARDLDVDLYIVGRTAVRQPTDVAGATFAKRLTAKGTCSVLVVPSDARPEIKKILVPVRLSDCSANALETAVWFASAWKAEIVCLNVYQVHGGYQRIGLTYEAFAATLADHARGEYEQLVKRVDLRGVPVSARYRDDPDDKPARHFAEAITAEHADLVVIGARGRTGPAGILLGHTTESLMTRSPVPVLAVKKKGECMGLFEAVMTCAKF